MEDIVRAMTRAISHRGPDGEGLWCDPVAGICLGHRRLAVIDLSATGQQPMVSRSRRYVIAFNGEIYNFRQIRTELTGLGHHFRGRSDTEVALAAIEQWGVQSAVGRFIGMFAFALWDSHDGELWLGRDRVGKKPLYYALTEDHLAFGSELKALLAMPDFDTHIDRQATGQFLRYGFIAAPQSVFSAARKLRPGCLARISRGTGHRIRFDEIPYWKPAEVFSRGRQLRARISIDDATMQLGELLSDAVRLRLESDVPLGAFLSGGIDSTVVVALMQRHASKPVNTYTIGFREKGFDEATYAADIARHLQTNHTEIYMSTTDVLDLVPRVPEVFDEPFGDSSQLPTILVSSVARRYVTVALSGDGGDEIFGGYRRYQRFWQLWRWLSVLPAPMRRYVGRAAELAARVPMEAIWRIFGCLVPGDAGRVTIPQQLAKIGQFAQLNGVDALYERQLTHWDNPSRVVESSAPPWWQCGGTDPGNRASAAECFERMMELDLGHYLPDDILVKVDRATMHVGLESRAPLLDHRVIEFAARLPVEMRIRPGHGKRVLRELAGSLVPASLIERPKQGFGVPLARWLRGPLREWADESLAKPQLARSGIIDPEPVAQLWHEHQNGHRDWAAQLWDVLMFQSWYAHHVGNRRWPARG